MIGFTTGDLSNMNRWFQLAFAKKNNSEDSDDKTLAKITGVLVSESDRGENRSSRL